MPAWYDRSGWMAFQSLDSNEGLTESFTLAHKVTDDSEEEWSKRFVRFKNKKEKAVWGAAYVIRDAVPGLFAGLGLAPAQTTIVTALSSGEANVDPKRAIPRLAKLAADRTGTVLNLGAITKKVHRPIHGIFDAAARNEELILAEYRSEKIQARNVVIFDDFITRGDTLSHIAQAIHASSGNINVYGLALGKTERRPYISGLPNAHVPKKWSKLWAEGEQAFLAKKE